MTTQHTTPPRRPLTPYERRIVGASPRDLALGALAGCVAAPVVYTWIVGWPPARPIIYGGGLGLVAIWLALVPLVQARTLRYRVLGPAGGITLQALVRVRMLSLGVRLLIVIALLLQSPRLSWGVAVAVVALAVCADPIKRYVASRTLRRLEA